MPKQGIETGRFGKWLYEYNETRELPFEIYYDHGNKALDSNVAVPKGFYGERVSNLTRLADVDIIVGSQDRRAILLIEIEERPVSPKKILGDVLAIMMCNSFAVKAGKTQKKEYRVAEDTSLILACYFEDKGYRMNKTETLSKRLKEFDGFPEGISSRNITFILENRLPKLIVTLRESVIKSLESRI